MTEVPLRATVTIAVTDITLKLSVPITVNNAHNYGTQGNHYGTCYGITVTITITIAVYSCHCTSKDTTKPTEYSISQFENLRYIRAFCGNQNVLYNYDKTGTSHGTHIRSEALLRTVIFSPERCRRAADETGTARSPC